MRRRSGRGLGGGGGGEGWRLRGVEVGMVVGKKRHKVCDCRNKQKHGALFVHRTYRYVLFWNRKVVVGSGVGGGGGETILSPNP